jgi:dihydrofolate synthase/folylpolyglutamate synthase
VDSGLSRYKTALDALFARTGTTAKFGLDRTLELLSILGNPHERIKTFHIAGTNGKGSVVITLYALLRAKGYRVGRYMSPHLVDFRERIVVDDEPIGEPYIIQFLERYRDDTERLGATFFEITTALAFHYFATRQVDVAIIETGLGGRLDSTNVITPLAAGITSIGMDHQEFLGDTESGIAREKAGILKTGVPCVIGALSDSARVSVYEVAREKGVNWIVEAERLYRTSNVEVNNEGTSFDTTLTRETVRLQTGLTGLAQAKNTSVALAMLRVAGTEWCADLDEAKKILPAVKLAGRFQRVGNLILDVAHNVDGINSIVETFRAIGDDKPLRAVVGILGDKDWQGMLVALGAVVHRMTLVQPPTAPTTRAWSGEVAENFARSRGIDATFERDFERAIKSARTEPLNVLVTGSFHTVGDALAILGENTL